MSLNFINSSLGTSIVYSHSIGGNLKHQILVIDDDINVRNSMRSFLQDEGFFVRTVSTGEEGIALIRQNITSFSLAIIDYHLKEESGTEVIKNIMTINPKFKVIGFSGDKAQKVSLDSYKSGAINFIEKGTSQVILLAMIHRLCKEYELENKVITKSATSDNQLLIEKAGMIGRSNALAEIAKTMLKASAANSSILIRGEPGTGKELVAKGIHNNSKRSNYNFIAINSGAISQNLTESELFGHDKGAFTGASQNKIGKFQAANKGTIFFDEIGEMSFDLQKILLRAIQERKITPVGSNLEIPVDVRIIAATNAPLEKMIIDKSFRQDLFDRLNVIPIFVPPLRDRLEDIPLLVEHFMKKINLQSGVNKEILEIVVNKIQKNPPSGNIRGLQNLVERLHTLSEGPKIDLKTLELGQDYQRSSSELISDIKIAQCWKHIEQIRLESQKQEKESILYALQNKKTLKSAAEFLDVTREYLRSRMRALKIEFNNETTTNLQNK